MRDYLSRVGIASVARFAMLAIAAGACTGQPSAPTSAAPTANIRAATYTPLPSRSPTTTSTPSPTGTPDPYAGLTIDELTARTYGEGEIVVERAEQPAPTFERVFFRYPSDGLRVHGFMNVPVGEGPFPVVLVLHGYINPADYQTIAYTSRYADVLAEAGYLVLHPNYRDYPPSDVGPNPFRIGYAIDVLNLIGLVRQQAGQPGPLAQADANSIGLFGHSMGGGIALRAMTVDPEIEAVVLYASMNADERLNHQKIVEWSGGRAGWKELNAPAAALEQISPAGYLDRTQAAVSIHHGDIDATVPPEWSRALCQQLTTLQLHVECFEYPSMPHTFYGESETLLLERAIDFYRRTLN